MLLNKMRKTNIKGFSLIELMVVVAIIGVLASIAVPNFQRFRRRAKTSEARYQLGALYTALQAFKAEFQVFYGDLDDIGYIPSGTIEYSVGFAMAGTAPTDPTFMNGFQAHTHTGAGCNMNAAPWDGCDSSGAAFMAAPTGTADPTATTFTAGAEGNVGGAMTDQWTMDQLKVMLHPQDGTY